MGLFNKKKSPAAAPPATGGYVAPTVALSPGHPGDIECAAPAGSQMGNDSSATSRTGTIHNTTTSHKKKDTLISSLPHQLPAQQTTVAAPTSHHDARSVGTYDDTRTYRTEYTTGGQTTVKTTGSDETGTDSAFTITKNGQYLTMNGFANGHLMRWKFAAEEGPAFIRFPALLLALGVIGTTIYPLVTDSNYWKLSTIICAFHTCVMASLIFVLEGRLIMGIRAPTGIRARIRAVVTRYLNLFRLLWGRGLLYIFVGSMSMTMDHIYADYGGLALMVFGIFAILSGAHASYNLDKMKSSLTDESFLWAHFDTHDHDHDNHIDLNQFSELLYELGLEFDDAYTFKAFSQINGNVAGVISFEQFRDWWIVAQNKGRPLKHGE